MTSDPEPESPLRIVRVPLEQGDPAWVFPTVAGAEADAVRALLAEADAHLRDLGARLGAPAALSYQCRRLEDVVFAGLFGVLELPDGVQFLAYLHTPHRCGWDLRWGPPWLVAGEIARVCPPPVDDCGIHVIADWGSPHDSPLDAAGALADTTDKLRELGLTRPRSDWSSARCPAPGGLDD
ncbi:hypothetical protein [Embleya sp. AB8]|uniref:hypothetical protein n=1 Tax=Embleya sp. AB8 TaxID=3156304 RepID=UPI003C7213D4